MKIKLAPGNLAMVALATFGSFAGGALAAPTGMFWKSVPAADISVNDGVLVVGAVGVNGGATDPQQQVTIRSAKPSLIESCLKLALFANVNSDKLQFQAFLDEQLNGIACRVTARSSTPNRVNDSGTSEPPT